MLSAQEKDMHKKTRKHEILGFFGAQGGSRTRTPVVHEFESCASTNSATWAGEAAKLRQRRCVVQDLLEKNYGLVQTLPFFLPKFITFAALLRKCGSTRVSKD